MIGRIEIIRWIAGNKEPLTGPAAAEALASALVDIVASLEPVRPLERRPVLERVERIHRRLHGLVEAEFQRRWRAGRFNR